MLFYEEIVPFVLLNEEVNFVHFSVLVHESLGDKDGSKTQLMSVEESPQPVKSEPNAVASIISDVPSFEPESERRDVLVEDVRIKSETRDVGDSRTARQYSMASSTFSEESSPQPDSGYATVTSASYDHELASVFEPSAPTPLSDSQHPTTSQANENATIGYRTYTRDDFDYTYGDDRRFVLDDDKENLYRFDGRAHTDDSGDVDESFDDEVCIFVHEYFLNKMLVIFG